MRNIHLILLSFLFFWGCKGEDFKINAPESSMNGDLKVNFDHNLFTNTGCIECHEKKRPVTINPHGNGADCNTCHTPALNSSRGRTWLNLINFNHNPMPATCAQCHESRRSPKAPHGAGQWGEKQDCANCHTYPSWNQARFDHNKPLTSCIECHQIAKDARPPGLYAGLHPSSYYESLRGFYMDLDSGSSNLTEDGAGITPVPLLQSQRDILTRLNDVTLIKQNDPIQMDCILCHTNSDNTKIWADTSITFRYSTHSPAPGSCIGCHEIQRPSSHSIAPKISGMAKGDCQGCHTFSKDLNGTGSPKVSDWKTLATGFDHERVLPQACMGCHNDDIPPTQRPQNASSRAIHPVANGTYYKIDCVNCHTFDQTNSPRAWNKIIFDYRTHLKSDGRKAASCIKCHKANNNSHTFGARLNNDCASCHTFDPVNKWQRFATSFNHAILELPSDRCDSCHKLLSQGKLHVSISQAYDCNSCHTTTERWKDVKDEGK